MALRAHVQFTPFDASSGAALTSATVNVFQPGTVTPVVGTLFDKNGNTLANPLTSDATTGLVDFYMNVAQEVDLQVAKSGFTTRTYSNVPVLDDAGNDLTALMTTTGDIVYASAANTPVRLAAGSANQILVVSAGVPSWSSTIAAGAANLAQAANILGADVLLNNTANYFDGPSMAQGVSGTWFASGTVTVWDTAGAATINVKLWDGTTVIASTVVRLTVASGSLSVTLSGYITAPAGNIRISAQDTGSTSGKILFNTSGNSKDSSIFGIRIA